jgi:hypothetical protein
VEPGLGDIMCLFGTAQPSGAPREESKPEGGSTNCSSDFYIYSRKKMVVAPPSNLLGETEPEA